MTEHPFPGVRWADEVLAVQVSAVADGAVTVTVTGEVDVLSAPLLQWALDAVWESDPRTVTVDLRGVTFLNAPGLRLLGDARQAAGDRGARLEVRTGAGRVARLLWRVGWGGATDDDAVAGPGHGWPAT
jgi:anti-anti-sigma factor